MVAQLCCAGLVALTLSLFTTYVGFYKLAELCVRIYYTCIGQRQHLQLANELESLKDQQARLSAIDNFAQWAKLNRQITGKQQTLDRLYSKYSFNKLKLEVGMSIALRIVIYAMALFTLRKLGSNGKIREIERIVVPHFATDRLERWILTIMYGSGPLGPFRFFFLSLLAFSVL